MAAIGEHSVLDADGIEAKFRRLAAEILEYCGSTVPVLVGIHTRGVVVATRLQAALAAAGCQAPMGTLDISLYRDDLDNRGSIPVLRSTAVPVPVDGARVILCDDVLFTGRTIRAALDGIMDLGRPAKIELAVLVDRGNRELPIQADYAGLEISTTRSQHVRVYLRECDGRDAVLLSDPD
jgi:pyrimidine operon attenuation protein / uracil phosphoribosyltransferase